MVTVPDLLMINNGTIYMSDLIHKRKMVDEDTLLGDEVPVLKVEVIPGQESNASML